jgi:hypothetical protein
VRSLIRAKKRLTTSLFVCVDNGHPPLEILDLDGIAGIVDDDPPALPGETVGIPSRRLSPFQFGGGLENEPEKCWQILGKHGGDDLPVAHGAHTGWDIGRVCATFEQDGPVRPG